MKNLVFKTFLLFIFIFSVNQIDALTFDLSITNTSACDSVWVEVEASPGVFLWTGWVHNNGIPVTASCITGAPANIRYWDATLSYFMVTPSQSGPSVKCASPPGGPCGGCFDPVIGANFQSTYFLIGTCSGVNKYALNINIL